MFFCGHMHDFLLGIPWDGIAQSYGTHTLALILRGIFGGFHTPGKKLWFFAVHTKNDFPLHPLLELHLPTFIYVLFLYLKLICFS